MAGARRLTRPRGAGRRPLGAPPPRPPAPGCAAVEAAPRPERSAKPRRAPSFPARFLAARGLVRPGERLLDHGCGRGVDVLFFRSLGVEAYCYDPYYSPDPSVLRPRGYDVVTSFFVLNVLPPRERRRVIRELARLVRPGGRVYVAVRSDRDTTIRGAPHLDVRTPSRCGESVKLN